MSPIEQRIAIAEACPELFEIIPGCGDVLRYKQRRDNWRIVDPLDDLNACHEMEKALTFKEGVKFRLLLARNSDGPRATAETVEAALCHATAAQRCEAFLKVKGLWKDTP